MQQWIGRVFQPGQKITSQCVLAHPGSYILADLAGALSTEGDRINCHSGRNQPHQDDVNAWHRLEENTSGKYDLRRLVLR